MTKQLSKREVEVFREAIALTAKMLTKSGVRVTMQGTTPYVAHRNGKVSHINLPPVPDNADRSLIDAMQGYLDHEVGHIDHTPFHQSEKIQLSERHIAGMVNVIEDIRIERESAAKYPGAKLNLSRMRAGEFRKTLEGVVRDAQASGDTKRILVSTFIPGLRALAGQPEMREFMDDKNLWEIFQPVIDAIPNLEARLVGLSAYDDVVALSRDIWNAFKTEPPSVEAETMIEAGTDGGSSDEDSEDEGDEAEDESDGDGTGESGAPSDDDDGTEGGDSDSDSDDRSGDDSDTDAGSDTDDGGPSSVNDGEDNSTGNITDAIRQLDATSRRVLYKYKKENKSVAVIASEVGISEAEVGNVLRNARRKLLKILKGKLDE